MVKHRFSGEKSAHGDPIDPTHQSITFPNLTAMRPAGPMHQFIGFNKFGADPGVIASARNGRTRTDDRAERAVKRDAKILSSQRPSQTV